MKRIHSFDFIKFFAIVGVIVIHSGMFWGNINGVDTSFLGFILNTLSRFAVPFFFITAGFMFSLKTEDYGVLKYYKKYIKLILIPYIVWSVIYLVDGAFLSGTGGLDRVVDVLSVGDFLYYGKKISEPLWFLPGLFISITITALAIRYKFIKVAVIIALVLNIVGLFGQGQNYVLFFPVNIFTRDSLFFGLFYTSLGAYLAIGEKYKKYSKNPKLWFVLAGLFALLMVIERYILVEISNWNLFGDFYLFTIPLTFSLFMGCLCSPELGKKSILTKFGRGTLGIYLIHSLVMIWVRVPLFNIYSYELYSKIWWHLFYVPVVFLLSWLLYYTIPGMIKKAIKKKEEK